MIKQVVFLKRRPDITMEEFMDYYENQHSQARQAHGRKAVSAQCAALRAALRHAGKEPAHGRGDPSRL